MRIIVLIALCVAAVSAVPADPQRIAGGSATTVSEYPAIAALLYSWNLVSYFQTCAGTILNNRSILTAAHCPYGDQTNRWRVRVGSDWSNRGGTVHNVSSIIINDAFNPWNYNNDIAILRTATTIVYNNDVSPAFLSGANYNLADNQVVWAAGWGLITENLGVEQLQHVQIWTVKQEICRQNYAEIGVLVNDNMLCSGWLDVGGRDQCQGDAGGALYHNGVVVGVCSFGYRCAHPRYPSVNTRVSRFISWVQSNA